MLTHPGGYSDCSSKEGVPDLQYMCMEFARRGFIFFNIEYRRGRITYTQDPRVYPPYKTVYQQLAGYRAAQDIKGAERSIIKAYYDNVFANKFKMDTSNCLWAAKVQDVFRC